ncbi:MAG: hypothetical protein HC923_09265 [Myxococcales bacterium]|nr:hypothetical protein [Myxococcales bacterium]
MAPGARSAGEGCELHRSGGRFPRCLSRHRDRASTRSRRGGRVFEWDVRGFRGSQWAHSDPRVRNGISPRARRSRHRISALAFDEDGERLVSTSYDRSVRVWNTRSGESQQLVGHQGAVKDAIILRDGRIASVCEGGDVVLWRPDGAVDWMARFSGANRNLRVRASPDGSVLVTGGHGGHLLQWSTLEDSVPRKLDCGFSEVTAFDASKDLRHVVCANAAGQLTWFDTVLGMRSVLFTHESEVESLAVSPDGAAVVSTDVDGQVRRIALRDRTVRTLDRERTRIAHVAWSADAGRVALGGWDGVVRVHDARDDRIVHLRGHTGRVAHVAFAGEGRLVSGGWDKVLRTWTVPHEASRRWSGHTVGVHAVAVSPNGRWVASGGHDETVRLWNVDTGRDRVLRGHTDHVYRVLFSPDGQRLASSSDDRTVRLWSVNGDDHLVLRGHDADVEELDFSANGRFLASAGEDDAVWLWDLASGGRRRLVAHRDHVTAVAFHPDGQRLASAGRDGQVFLWSTADRSAQLISARPGEVTDLSFTARGDQLAIARPSGRVEIYDMASETGASTYESLDNAAFVRFSPDDRYLAVGSRGTKLWLCWRAYRRCDLLPELGGDLRDLTLRSERPGPRDRVGWRR